MIREMCIVTVAVAAVAGTAGASIVGFVGDTTLEGGWYAFEDEFDVDMTPIVHGGAMFETVSSIEVPEFGGSLDFDVDHSLRYIDGGWGGWSHGYLGEVFYSNGAVTMGYDLNMDDAYAFDAYIVPNPTSWHSFNAIAYGSAGGEVAIVFGTCGFTDATHFGFYATGETIERIEIQATCDWAIGEWRVGVPGPGSLMLLGIAGVFGRRRIRCWPVDESSGGQDVSDNSTPIIGLAVSVALGMTSIAGAEVVGFLGGQTLEEGWYAFEDEFDVEMTVIQHGGSPYDSVISIEVPEFGGSLGFDFAHSLRHVGYGWATWGHGYAGEVFYNNGAGFCGYDLNMQGVRAFDTFINTDIGHGFYSVTAYGSEGGLATIFFDQYWSEGALHFGFYSPDEELVRIEIESDGHSWAMGEWRVGVPGPASMTIFAIAGLCAVRHRRR